jgi:hypothetical protein
MMATVAADRAEEDQQDRRESEARVCKHHQPPPQNVASSFQAQPRSSIRFLKKSAEVRVRK